MNHIRDVWFGIMSVFIVFWTIEKKVQIFNGSKHMILFYLHNMNNTNIYTGNKWDSKWNYMYTFLIE